MSTEAAAATIEQTRKAAMFGLAGGMGAGKSTARKELGRLGAYVIDADQTMRELRKPGQAGFVAMVGILGEGILDDDGTIDTQKVSAAIFADADLKQEVEQAAHPLIWSAMYGKIETLGEDDIAVLEVPLMTPETAKVFDGVVVINTERERAIGNLVTYRNVTREEAEARINTQMTNEQRAAMADYTVHNDGTRRDFITAIREGVWPWLQEVAAERRAAIEAGTSIQ